MSSSKVDPHLVDITLGQRAALGFIRLYQITLSSLIGGQCRFYPSCSHYATQAIESHGVVGGGWLALKRLGRCHPFNPGGVDLVPEHVHASQCGPQDAQPRLDIKEV